MVISCCQQIQGSLPCCIRTFHWHSAFSCRETDPCLKRCCALHSKIYQFFVHRSKRFNYPEIHGAISVISHVNYHPFFGKNKLPAFSTSVAATLVPTDISISGLNVYFYTWVEIVFVFFFLMAGNSTPFITPKCFVRAFSTSFEKWTMNTLQKSLISIKALNGYLKRLL